MSAKREQRKAPISGDRGCRKGMREDRADVSARSLPEKPSRGEEAENRLD